MVDYTQSPGQNVIPLHGRKWMTTTSGTLHGGSSVDRPSNARRKERFPTVIPWIRFGTYDRTLFFNVVLLTLGMTGASFVIAFVLLSLGTLFDAG